MSSPRTNNFLEGWHSKLKQNARKAHPNMFELVEIFKQEHSEQSSQLIRTRKLENQDQISLEHVRRISAQTAI